LIFDPGYRRLKDYVVALTGLAYYADKDDDLCSRIARRLAELGLQDCDAYLNLLRDGTHGETERDKLIEQLTIGETFFFRHQELFAALRDTVLPDAIARNSAHRRLRIWSAGCSVGAEAYSLSILLKRDLAPLVKGWEITILGTDINREFLARARQGRYETWAFRSVPDEVKRACFSPCGAAWQLAPQFQDGVSFQYHNLVDHPFPSLVQNLFAFDVILCRNVMIYFSQEIIRHLIGRFHDSLVDGGWLLVGHAEPNVETFRAFRTVNATGAVLYQKARNTAPQPLYTPPNFQPLPSAPKPAPSVPWIPPAITEVRPPRTARPPISQPSSAVRVATAATSPFDEIRALADQGQLEQALRCCEKLLTSHKLNAAAHFYHGLILEQMGLHAETEQALRRAIYLDRRYVLAHYYLGLTLQRQGQFQRAERSFRNVLSLLSAMDHQQPLSDADNLTVGDLESLTNMHLEALSRPRDHE
jgi:chemotaxis protein methyltransferase CheR